MTRKTTASIVDIAALVKCSRSAAPVATTSNGEPPPESEFDSWLLLVGSPLGATSEADVVLEVGIASVAVVSRVKPDDDVLEA